MFSPSASGGLTVRGQKSGRESFSIFQCWLKNIPWFLIQDANLRILYICNLHPKVLNYKLHASYLLR